MNSIFNSQSVGPSARTAIDIAEASEIAAIAGRVKGSILSRDEVESLLGSSALILDGIRRKPRYFDGRMLTGADLTRDQDYIRQRQNDLASATGTGIVTGLRIALSDDPRGQNLVIEAGHGVTPSGAIVMVEEEREIGLLDIPEIRRLDATLGLARKPNLPLGRRTGLFILALRPVEFSANPLSTYPTEITGQRRVEDGDIVEATAISLISYPDGNNAGSLDEARRIVAKSVFGGSQKGIPQDALPLAMIALERGIIRWIDTPMVRRETGSDTPLQVAMGARPRALAEAFMLQHGQHLRDVMNARRGGGQDMRFPAREYFSFLPPAGQLPAAAIAVGSDGLEQMWFPPGTDVAVSFVPSDEIATIVEESLTLPPIDLEGGQEAIDGISIVVLAAVPRPLFHHFAHSLEQLDLKAKATAGAASSAKPIASLNAMLARRASRVESGQAFSANPSSVILTEEESARLRLWQAALSEAMGSLPQTSDGTPMLYYVRRRAVAYSADAVGKKVEVSGDNTADNGSSEEHLEAKIEERIGELNLKTRFNALKKQSTSAAGARISELLSMRQVIGSDLFTVAAIKELEEAVPKAEEDSAVSLSRVTAATSATTIFPALAESRLSAATILGSARLAPTTRVITRENVLREELASARLARGLTIPKLLSEGDVIAVARNFKQAELGEGIRRLGEASDPGLYEKKAGMWLGDTGRALEIDLLGLKFASRELQELAQLVGEAIEAQKGEAIEEIVQKYLGG